MKMNSGQLSGKKKETGGDMPVTRGGNEVEAAVNAVVNNVLAVDAALLVKVGIIPVLHTPENGLPAVRIVNEVTVANSIQNIELQLNTALIKIWRRNECDERIPTRREGGERTNPR